MVPESAIKQSDIVLDVGAHIGTLQFLQLHLAQLSMHTNQTSQTLHY
jgi:hypothetical protein